MNKTKAFIFDMDGVIIDSESLWEEQEQKFLPILFGYAEYNKIQDQILGNAISNIYDLAVQNGCNLDKKIFFQTYDYYAEKVYSKASFTPGIYELVEKLSLLGYKLAIVSASPQKWINMVLARLMSKATFELTLSLNDRPDLKSKPFPDGYREAMKKLQTAPENTYILEDSNRGIQSAKASGAFTIGLTENLPTGYKQLKADMKIQRLIDLDVYELKSLIRL